MSKLERRRVYIKKLICKSIKAVAATYPCMDVRGKQLLLYTLQNGLHELDLMFGGPDVYFASTSDNKKQG